MHVSSTKYTWYLEPGAKYGILRVAEGMKKKKKHSSAPASIIQIKYWICLGLLLRGRGLRPDKTPLRSVHAPRGGGPDRKR